MLKVSEIAERIKSPNLLSSSDISSMEELSVKYPYTQLFSILYLKALGQNEDLRFEDELKKHSYRISDRVQLYNLINTHERHTEITIEPVDTEEPVIETQPEPKLELPQELKEIEEIKSEKSITTTEPNPISIETEETTIQETEKSSENISKQDLIEQSDIELTEEQDLTFEIPNDQLDESILHHALASNYALPELTEQELLESEEKNIIKEKEEQRIEIEIEEISKPDKKDKHSFTEWLHVNDNYKERDASEKDAIDSVVADFSEFDPSMELFGEVKKPKKEFFSPIKKAKESLEESELPVSETLAKIYIMQGNYPQAISAYEQLSLAFPEKKIFFANLIEDLRKKINT